MKKVLFIDRDGTLILEPHDEQIDSLDKLEFYPGVFNGLGRIARSGMYELVIVSNQDGLGTDRYPEENFHIPQSKIIKAFQNEGIHFSDVHIDRSFAHEKRPTRKPGTGLLQRYFSQDYDLASSFVIGDRLTDLELARNLGAQGILLGSKKGAEDVKAQGLEDSCALITNSWEDIANLTLRKIRKISHRRKTSETDVQIELNLDGSAVSSIHTGLGFFDHMLEQLARHGKFDLSIDVKGDLHIDEHHTIEDTALGLGEAIALALGDKRGIERYGFCLPMDDALAQVAVDFGGRPWLVWEVVFQREKIGDVPTEMFQHFFKSFSDAARCNLNIKAEGQNEHHKIESIFKAFARAIRMAVKSDGTALLPTTKGVI